MAHHDHIAVIVDREPQLYASVGDTVSMDEIATIADRFGDVFQAVSRYGLTPTGAPFLRYRTISMGSGLTVEACVPVDASLPAHDVVSCDTLPGGRYVVSTYTGHFDGLREATTRVLTWGSSNGLHWDTSDHADGEAWAGRVEIYETDPTSEPDPSKWVTTLAFKLR